MRIVWDERKRVANLAKHGLDFATLDEAFFERASISSSYGGRLIAVGLLDGVVTVIFMTLGREAISIVSMRPASRKERMAL